MSRHSVEHHEMIAGQLSPWEEHSFKLEGVTLKIRVFSDGSHSINLEPEDGRRFTLVPESAWWSEQSYEVKEILS